MNKFTTKMTVQGAVIAAVYVVLTLVFAPISYGVIQFRISEALCILPYFTVAAVPGVSIGCLLANILGGAALPDIIFGTLATLIGAICSYKLRSISKWLVCVPPIAANTVIIPLVLKFAYGMSDLIPYMMLTVGAGEVLAAALLGNILMLALEPKSSFIFGSENKVCL